MKNKSKKIIKALAVGAIACLSVGFFAGCEQLTVGDDDSKINCSCNHESCEHQPCTHELCNHEKCTNQYVVYFHPNNNDDTIINFIKEGDTIDMEFFKDLKYIKEYGELEGWCTDAALQNLFDETTKITKNLNLYAKWKLKDGYNSFVSTTNSMLASNIRIGDVLVYKESLSTDEYEVGDIIVFYPTIDGNVSDKKVCHTITQIIVDEDNVTYITKGTSNSIEDSWIVKRENVIGEAVDILMRDGEIVDEQIIKN